MTTPLEIYYNPNATPRDRALAAIQVSRQLKCDSAASAAWLWAYQAAHLAREAGIGDAYELLASPGHFVGGGDFPALDALEAALKEIKYTVLVVEMPADAVARLANLPDWIKKDLGIVGLTFPESEEQ